MGDYAADALMGWIKSGMPRGKSFCHPVCGACSQQIKTITGNWTVCDDGVRHNKRTLLQEAEATERRAVIERNV